MEEEEQERKRKVEAGKAKLAQFRQRKGQTDSQTTAKKSKKKKGSSGSKHSDRRDDAPETSLSQSDETQCQSAKSGASTTAEFTITRTVPHGEIIKHNQTFTIEEEEFGVRETYSEHGTQSSPTRLEVMEDELAGKQQEIEELNRELEEMRAAYGTEGLQQLQEFEMAIKQRDGIITQLTTNLQQARKEKDDIMREFLELTEQSQNLKIQFQHLQASETIRNTSRTSTAADLFQSRQQIFTYQQQLEEQEQRLKHYQKENEELQLQLVALQEETRHIQQVRQSELEASYAKKLTEKDLTVNGLKSALIDEEQKSCQLKEMITAADRTVHELREELTLKSQEINSLTEELNISKQKERRSSEEIKQLMGTVEDLQKKHHKDAQSEADIVHRLELETQRKLEQLQAELDEMYGQQIVQMKQELVKQHTLEIEKLGAEHKATVENLSNQTEINAQIQTLTSTVSGLNSQLQHADEQSTKMKEDLDHRLEAASSEKSLLQRQIEDLLQDLSFAREQIHRARQTISEKESRLNEANSLQATIESLRSELASANEFTKELETKHEAEVTNYKIKLDMLEREKDAVLGRMAESQEAELEKLRTYFLFSQEEELSKLREDLAREHRINVENLKANLDMQYNERMDRLQREMGQIICDLQSENEGLLTNQDSLVVEMSKLSELLQSVNDPKSAATMTQVNEVRVDLDSLTKGQEKGSVEQELQALQLKIELLQAELKDKHIFRERIAALELDNTLLKEQNNTLQKASKKTIIDHGETSLSDGANADSLVFKREIEILSAENKRLCNLELQSREEIERQKNTFSFAEKNFEVNYHELQEEYTCLLNIKVQLEEDQAKLDEEYQLKLCALNDELSKLKLDSKQANDSALEGSLTLVEADALGGVEVVEKDTTELMEKLEIAQRDKQELSQRVSDLSEQVHLKQREINQLKEQVKSLHGERDHLLGDGQEAEESRKSVHPNNCTSSYSLVDFGELQPETQNLLEEKEPSPKASTQSISTLRDELFLLRNVQCERDGLQNQLAIMQQEQADMRLQMEAQRISLSQIHLAHMNLVSENFQTEKAQEIHSLKEEMQRVQEQKLEELQDGHQQELKELWVEHPETRTSGDVSHGEAVGSSNTLIEMLRKRIHNEYNHINQYIHIEKPTNVVNETKYVEMSVLQESSRTSVVQKNLREAQTVHTHLMTLLDTLLEEYKRVTELYSSVEQTCGLHMNEEKQESDVSSIIQTSCKSSPPPHHTEDLKTRKITTSLSEGAEKFKNEFNVQRTQLEEKHTQEIEHLRSYFQQQLKETEERYTMEIIRLQEQLHSVSQASLEFRVPSGSQSVLQLGVQEADLFNSVFGAVSKELKMADEAHCGPIYHQLNILRQSLYSRYVEEVNALKKQHEAELDHLKVDLTGKYTLENAALKEEVVQLKQAAKENLHGNIAEFSLHHNGNLEEDNSSDINQLLEERYRERIVEEIARVIVEMTVGFAQQTELARLATLTDGKDETSREGPAESGDKLLHNEDTDDEQRLCDEEKSENLQSEVVKSQGETPSTGSQNVPTSDVKNVDFDVFLSSDQSLFTGQTSGQSPTHQDRETLLKEKTVVLNEKDYNQMVAMGAESAKLYEERVEDMRQELVRLEQEHQQATEALRLAHAAQLERQMCDQEQLLTELQTVRAQLAENVMVYSENQATERERILIEELESLKLARLENREKQGFMCHENSSQTEDESVRASECDEELQEGATGSAEGNEETQVVPPSDLSCDRNTLKRANKRLSKILLEIVKTTGAVEETIGRHVVGLLDKSGRRLSNTKVLAWCPDAACDTEAPLAGSAIVSDLEKKVPSWSGDEGSKLPQLLTEEELDVNPEDEGHVLNIVTRLQAAVEKLLEAINNTSNQLEHAKAAQTELVRESIKRKQETTGLLRIQEELQERLNEEAKAREHLAVELGKAEGLLDGYTDDRVFLEKQMQEKNDLIQHLEQELHSTGNRLQEFEQERQQIQEERELLSRQKNALKADTGTAEQRLVDAAVDAAPKEELLEETEKLFKEKIEVQRQAEKDSGDFHKQVKVLETELEDQVNRYLELEQEKNAELEDLRQKNLALEKQLEKTRKFLDEQAVDREHERDVFQQEIQKLEQQLKMPQRHQPTNGQQSNQVETLENNLKEKTDKCNELLLSKEQLQRDVQERNEEIEKLECRIRELEQAVLISADNLQKVEERRSSIIKGVKGEMPLEALLQVEREAMDRKEKEITNLEEQLEQFREELENKNEEVQQLHMQLEIQKKESATKIHGLEQESKLLKDEFEDLQHKLQGDSTFKTSKPGKHEELLLLKDQEIDQLSEQISRLQAQVEAAPDNKVIEEKNEQIKEYKSQIKCLKSDQERLRKNSEEEIEKLNEVIEKLQEELARIEQKGPIDRPRMTEVGYNNKHKLEDIAEEEETLQKNFAVGETEINPAKIAHLEIKAGDLESLKDSKGSNGKRTMSESNHSNSLESEMEASEQSLANPMFPSLLDMETQLHELQQVIKEKDSELLQYSSQVKEMKEQVQVVEHLNSVIQKLQMELAERDQNISLELTSLAEDAESSKHHLETVTGEKSTIPEDDLIRATMTVSLADFEATEFELKSLKEELKTLKERPSSSMIGITAGSTNRGTMTEGNAADIKKLEEELREKTANHLAKEILLQSIQETAQSTVHSLETQIQELQKAIKEKDSELSRRANQAAMLEEQVHQIERLNGTIRTLQNNMTSLEERMSIDFNKRVEALQEEKELFRQKAETNDEAVDEAIAEMEDAKMEVKMLEDKIQNLLAAQESKAEQERTNILSNDGKVTEDLKATLEKMEDALRDKTAQLLASQALYTSMQESMQSVINSLESQLQELKIIIQVKDSEMLQLEDQMELLSKRTEEINQLNGVIATLQKELSHAMQKSTPQTLLKSKDSERINQNLTTAMPQEGALHQDARLNNDEMNLTLLELEETKSKVKVLKEELEKLRMAREIAQNASDDTAFGLVKAKVESRPADGKDGQEILGEKHESLLTNQAWQTTINAMEAELQELQKVLAEKDLELLQYSNEIELLKEQVKAEGDQHDQMMVAMEDTLREKVAAALVSEAQIKAIQVHTTKLMQRSDVISVLEENSKGTQASASTEGKEAESKLSELSLRLLQLEKQLADLHEELQVERDNVNAANQQAAEKECKLRELQSVLESTTARPRDVQIAIQPGDEERITSQSNAMADLGQELEIVKAEAAATKEELCHYRELAEKLKEEMTMKETRVAHLQEELCNTKKVLSEVEERLSQYLKREEELAEQNKQSLDLLDGIGGPGQPAFERTTSSSQTDNASSVHNGNQTTRVHHVDKEVQKDMDTRQKRVASDEVQELVEQYSEKFGQMQDLHAAEILDMEARHIAEADSLRRETYVAVQSLTEECESLKAVIEALKSERTIPGARLSESYKFPDAVVSDTDWSQGFYGQGFDSTAEEMGNDDGVDVEALSGFLPSKIKTLLRAVHQEGIQVLSLSESAIAGQNMQLPGTSPQFWMEERKSLVETIGCLKKLIGKMQNEDRSELGDGLDFPDGTPDWRGDLLQAIQDVFCKEQEVLMAAYHTQLDTLGTCDAATLVKQMQHRLEEMGVEQINAMDCIQNADRRSLLLEIQDLRSQLSGLRSVGTAGHPFHLHFPGDVIDNTVQEDQPAQTRKTHTQLNVPKTKGTEVHSERSPAAEMNDELAQTKQKLESALKPGHTHFKELESLRMEFQQRSDELDVVHKALMNEQKKNRDLQWALEEERAKTEKSDVMEDLDIIIEDQRLKNEELSILLETEKQIVKGLQDRISSMEMAHESELSQERSNSSELQTVLQVEKARSAELANAFHIKREMESQTESHVGEGQMPEINPAEDLLQELHGQLESKHQHVVALTSEVESTRLECEQLRQSLEEARASHLKELLAQQDSANTAHQQAEALKSQVEDLQRKLKKTMLDLQKLEVDRTRLKETVQNLQNNVHEEPDGSRAERKGLVDSAAVPKALTDRSETQALHHKGGGGDAQGPGSVSLDTNNGETSANVESIRRRLERVSTKLKQLATKAAQRIVFEEADDEDFAWSGKSLQDVLSQLEHVAVSSLQERNFAVPPGSSTNSLTERLLTQNAELTGHVSRLTEEKNDLRNALLRMEDETSRYMLTGSSGDHSPRSPQDSAVNIDRLMAIEREQWKREKLQYQKSLKECEAELHKVKAELKSVSAHRDTGRECENSVIKRVYGKYLRSESFRKALVYQKKYLLLLLGGFQECEEATLSLIARMGGLPSYTDLTIITNRSRAFTRFRSAVRVSIAISRMKFLVCRWQKAAGSSTNRNGFGQNTGNEVRTDSTYLASGHLDHYGGHRHSSCRSRSGFDSPMSTVNSHHRYSGGLSDLSPCSHIQNYDPDRALTDYITRLEALQKRLGGAQTASTVSNTTRYGIRR